MNSGRTTCSTPRRWMWWLFAIVVAVVIGIAFAQIRQRPGDTAVYRLAAYRYFRGEPIYQQTDEAAFTYPPFFVFAYMPFSLLPPPWDRAFWCAINVLLMVLVIRTIIDMLYEKFHQFVPDFRHRVLWILACIILCIRFAVSPITYQSHEYIVLSLVVVGIWYWSKNPLLCGGIMGVAAACKATPLLFLPVFLWRRQFGAALSMVIAAGVATLVPDVFEPRPRPTLMVWEWYHTFVAPVDFRSAPDVPGAWRRWNHLNQSLSGTLYRLTTPVPTSSPWQWNVSIWPLSPRSQGVLILSAKLFVLGLVAWCTWRGVRCAAVIQPPCSLAMGSAVLCGMLLLSPMSSRQHFCSLIPVVFTLMFDLVCCGPQLWVTMSLVVVGILGLAGGKDLVGPQWQRQVAALGDYTWCTLLCLIACSMVLHRWRLGGLVCRGSDSAADES